VHIIPPGCSYRAAAFVAAVMVMAVSGCSSVSAHRSHQTVFRDAAPAVRHLIVGVFEPDDPGSYWQVRDFARRIGREPGLVVYYSNWGAPFAAGFARDVRRHGGRPLVQIDPRGVSLTAIADGAEDDYLREYAEQLRAYHHPVIISFGQEMNGDWYPWGAGHVSARVFIAAWRHMVTLLRALGATNAIWLWDVNCDYRGSLPIRDWWPGQSYVDWVGLDAYYETPQATFSSIAAPTIVAIRRFTRAPIILAETAVGPDTHNVPAKIRNLFAGVVGDHLLGLVWFDQAQSNGIRHQDWRLENNPAAMLTFRIEARRYR
jgi:hypothetical protein